MGKWVTRKHTQSSGKGFCGSYAVETTVAVVRVAWARLPSGCDTALLLDAKELVQGADSVGEFQSPVLVTPKSGSANFMSSLTRNSTDSIPLMLSAQFCPSNLNNCNGRFCRMTTAEAQEVPTAMQGMFSC